MIYDDNDQLGEIYIKPNNFMKATYTLYAVGSSDVFSEIEIAVNDESTVETELTVRAYEEYELPSEIEIKYRGISDQLAEIQPIGHLNMPAEIEVRSGNRMWALFEVQEPPKLTTVLNPFKDSLTRSRPEFQALNYGNYNSLMIGQSNGDIYHSFIQFDLTDWHPQFRIVESKLRLHYSGLIPQGAKIEIYALNEEWQEYGITHLNKPDPVYLIIDEYEDFPSERYVEFDLTEEVIKWATRTGSNYGIMLRLADDSTDTTVTFRSRESSRPPELIITYYDARIYSTGRSQVSAEIFVWRVGGSDISAEIEVHSVVGESFIPAELYVHRYEVPVDCEIDAEITVTRREVGSELIVSRQDKSENLAEVSVRVEGLPSEKEAEITVSKPDQPAEIFVKYYDDILSELVVQRHEDSDILAEISVTRRFVDSEIFVKYTDSIESVIEVQRHEEYDVLAEISVTKESIYSEITPRVVSENDISAEIYARLSDENVKLAEITVSRKKIFSEITPRLVDHSDIYSEIYSRAIDNSEQLSEITVTRETIPAEITVTHYDDVNAEIYVKFRDDIHSEITVTVFDDILSEIDVVQVSKKESTITITRPSVLAEITVPYWDNSDVLAEILPRILQASDIYSEIYIAKKTSGSYAYIM